MPAAAGRRPGTSGTGTTSSSRPASTSSTLKLRTAKPRSGASPSSTSRREEHYHDDSTLARARHAHEPDGAGETYSVAETFLSASYSQNFSDRFSAGFSAKLISDALGATKATGFAVDFGTNFHAMLGERPIRAAFVIANLGTNLRADGSGLEAGVPPTPPLGTVDIPQEEQPARLRASGWGLPVFFRVGVSLDVVARGQNRLTLLSEFSQPSNNKPTAGAGLEYAMTNLGNSGFSLAARGSYTAQPANTLDPGAAAGFTSKYNASSFTSDGLAVGGGIGDGPGDWKIGLHNAHRNLGPLGGTNFLSFSLGW